jgi:hypothetical protein
MTLQKRTKRTVGTVALLLMLVMALLLALPTGALAWNNCPKGLVNDPYPGACGRYVDTNGDSICDLSQSAPVASTTTTTAATTTSTTKVTATTTTVAVATSTSGEPPTGTCPLGPCLGCGACASFSLDTTVDSTISASGLDTAAAGAVLVTAAGSVTTSTTTPTSGGSGSSATAASVATVASAAAADSGGASFLTHYMVSPIALGFFLIYAVSFALYKTKRIRIATHRKIWNVLLLATFLITGIFGLLLTIQLDYTLPFTIPINILFWHVEAGIVMTLISLFHMGWHFNYYRNLVRTGRKKIRAAREAERAGDRARVPARPQLVLETREQRMAERETARIERERARAAHAPGHTPGPVPSHWAKPEVE